MRDGFEIGAALPSAGPGDLPARPAPRVAQAPEVPIFEVSEEAFTGELGYRTGTEVIVNSGHMVPVRLQVTEVYRRDGAGDWVMIHRHSSVAAQ
ncbi:hypothetical protein C4N9_06740 [Pararhodobacter marinus]|uniref:DUF4440 domain-containing protein n=1 Tax=Pararhodobacter marinus TaxID=2184063 RepID=A0A2U2CF18_9RHOB|nr:hypothetical protein [Pararhodobacter marinus]PWE30374.1 hypothetical protein C4N9_06740 [Pararhodobacter marinus]